jgi:hypothetical protein
MATAETATTVQPGFSVAMQAKTPATTSARTTFGARWRHNSGTAMATAATTPSGDRPSASGLQWPSARAAAMSTRTSGSSRVSAALRTRLI